jgi:hypothetical protein
VFSNIGNDSVASPGDLAELRFRWLYFLFKRITTIFPGWSATPYRSPEGDFLLLGSDPNLAMIVRHTNGEIFKTDKFQNVWRDPSHASINWASEYMTQIRNCSSRLAGFSRH